MRTVDHRGGPWGVIYINFMLTLRPYLHLPLGPSSLVKSATPSSSSCTPLRRESRWWLPLLHTSSARTSPRWFPTRCNKSDIKCVNIHKYIYIFESWKIQNTGIQPRAFPLVRRHPNQPGHDANCMSRGSIRKTYIHIYICVYLNCYGI